MSRTQSLGAMGLFVFCLLAVGVVQAQVIGDWKWGAGGVMSPYTGTPLGNYSQNLWHATAVNNAVATNGQAEARARVGGSAADDEYFNFGKITNFAGARNFTVTFEDVRFLPKTSGYEWQLLGDWDTGGGFNNLGHVFYLSVQTNGSGQYIASASLWYTNGTYGAYPVTFPSMLVSTTSTFDLMFVYDGTKGTTNNAGFAMREGWKIVWPAVTWISSVVTQLVNRTNDVVLGKYVASSSVMSDVDFGRVTLDFTKFVEPPRPATKIGQWDWTGSSLGEVLLNKLNPGVNDAVLVNAASAGSGFAYVGTNVMKDDYINFGNLTNIMGARQFSWEFEDITLLTNTAHYLAGAASGSFATGGDPWSWGYLYAQAHNTAGSATVGFNLWGLDMANNYMSNWVVYLGGQTILPNTTYDMQFFFNGFKGTNGNLGFRMRPGADTTWGNVQYFNHPIVRVSTNLTQVNPTLLGKYATGSSLGSRFKVGKVTVDLRPPPVGTLVTVR
jgi:hypothetical protein